MYQLIYRRSRFVGKIQITQSGRVYLVVNDDLEEGDEKSNNEDDQSGSGPAAPRVKRYEVSIISSTCMFHSLLLSFERHLLRTTSIML